MSTQVCGVQSFFVFPSASWLAPTARTTVFHVGHVLHIKQLCCVRIACGALIGARNCTDALPWVCRYLDGLPTSGDASGRAFRDLEWEKKVLAICQEMGIGAQFGGKYFCHDVRVIRVCLSCCWESQSQCRVGLLDAVHRIFMRMGLG